MYPCVQEWSEDEDEVMTDDDDEEEGEEGGRGVHWPSAMTDSGVAATPVDDIVVVIPAHSAPWRAPVEAARAALQQSVTPDYWAAPHGRPVTDRPGGQRSGSFVSRCRVDNSNRIIFCWTKNMRWKR